MITQLEGQMGGGKISAGGSVGLRPELHMNVALKAQSIRLRYPEGTRAIVDSNLTLSGTTDSATLDGRELNGVVARAKLNLRVTSHRSADR